MDYTSDLRILLPTSFSDPCFRMNGPLAQLADVFRVRLTIVHVAKPGSVSHRTKHEIESFLGEADHYDDCRRLLVESDDPVRAIARICERERTDLVMSPASDRLGLYRLLMKSFRGRLLDCCRAPLWTAGDCLDGISFRNKIRTISCIMNFDNSSDLHVRLAAAMAWRTGAQLRLVNVVEPVHEGTLARSFASEAPLMAGVSEERLRGLFAGGLCPEIDVVMGEPERELRRLLSRTSTDLAFAGPGLALAGPGRLGSFVDKLPCPVICADGGSARFEGWPFGAVETSRSLVAAESEFSLVH